MDPLEQHFECFRIVIVHAGHDRVWAHAVHVGEERIAASRSRNVPLLDVNAWAPNVQAVWNLDLPTTCMHA